jgi:hypothetical protein
MVIKVKCPFCGHKWKYKGSAIKATCPSCYNKIQIRSLPDPAPGPRKAPPAVKKLLKKSQNDEVGPALSQAIERSQAPEVELVRGETKEKTAGRVIQTQTITVPAPKTPRVRPLTAREVTGNCNYCQNPLRGNPLQNVMLDESDKYHSTCILTKIIDESGGDLASAAAEYGVPLAALQQRVLKLRELGKQLPEGILV